LRAAGDWAIVDPWEAACEAEPFLPVLHVPDRCEGVCVLVYLRAARFLFPGTEHDER